MLRDSYDPYLDDNKFSDNANAAIGHAYTLAQKLGNRFLSSEHLLLGILSQKQSAGAQILESAGIGYQRIAAALDQSPKTRIANSKLELSESTKVILQTSCMIAKEYHQDVCGTEHLLLRILQTEQSRVQTLLTSLNISTERLVRSLESALQSRYSDTVVDQRYRNGGGETVFNRRRQQSSILGMFGVDFTDLALKHKLDKIVGRAQQIQRAITILNRRIKNNPVLIGDPGVGKTAIVEGLAQKIINEDVPAQLLDKRIVSLDLSAMIAGTKYRGEFEDRIKRIIAEVQRSENIILFIDEMHLLVGAGAAEGAIDAGSILKPALARGNLQVIGATTTAEYTKYVEKDAALERRFQPIMVPEATEAETKVILKGICQHYADYHRIEISDQILDKIVRLSNRYLNDRFLPDKAIDLLDEAGAHLRVSNTKRNPAERQKNKQILDLREQMRRAGDHGDYIKAAKVQREIQVLQKHSSIVARQQSHSKSLQLKEEHLAHVISTWTGVPVHKIVKSEANALLNLETTLGKRIIGQLEAVKSVANAIRRSRSGITDPRRPVGSFLFLGPTGVGKSELARVLAEEFYGRKESLIKIDMSEFSQPHTVARLIGAPPGYVGFDHLGQLSETVRRNPYSLVLFDEIEKAHPDIFNLLLQILEDGCLADAKGKKIDFSNTIVILTSNIGAEILQSKPGFGFTSSSDDQPQDLSQQHQRNQAKILKELRRFMKPELINRLDKIIVFKNLSKEEITKIVKIELLKFKQRLLEQKFGIIFSSKVKSYLVKEGYNHDNGVRPLKRLIQTKIEDRVAQAILEGKYKSGDVISVKMSADKVVLAHVKE